MVERVLLSGEVMAKYSADNFAIVRKVFTFAALNKDMIEVY